VDVNVAVAAFLLDVGHFAPRRQLTITTDHAPAGKCPEPEEPYQTHCPCPPLRLNSNSYAAPEGASSSAGPCGIKRNLFGNRTDCRARRTLHVCHLGASVFQNARELDPTRWTRSDRLLRR
jgi:hypothetical protein